MQRILAITIIIPHAQILPSDMDFFVSGEHSKELLRINKEEGMYPPRFNLVSCTLSLTVGRDEEDQSFRG